MVKTIAICTDVEIQHGNKMFDYEFAKQFFGMGILYYFREFLPEYQVTTGGMALKMIEEKQLDPKDVFVFQEQFSGIGEELIKKGAFAHTIYCYESQIYAKNFYRELDTLPQKFKNRIFFEGMFDYTKNCDKVHNFHAHFLSYDDDDILEPKDWDKRDFISLVMGNKYIEHGNGFPREANFKTIYKWARKCIYKNHLDKYLEKNELQNKRLELIEFFGSKKVLKLYGNGWDSLDNLPKTWKKRLTKIIEGLNPKPVDDKFDAISNCKFNLCIENLQYKGYITEKIIHSFVVGSIPVYLGAPDIEKYIPKNCFIDIRDFKTNEELFAFMKNLSPEKAQEYIKHGRDFLNSDEGQKYSFKGGAKFWAELVKSEKETICTTI